MVLSAAITAKYFMRYVEILKEAGIEIHSRYSGEHATVHMLRTGAQLDALLHRHSWLRGILEDNVLFAWDGNTCTHRAAEDQLGLRGWRLVLSSGDRTYGVEYNVHDGDESDLTSDPFFRRLFKRRPVSFTAND